MGRTVGKSGVERSGEGALSIHWAAEKVTGGLAFSLMTALGAFIYLPLPFTPVPLTLQTFFVLLAGAFLGKGGGALSQGIYISMASLGLPIWAGGGSGLCRLWGPTGGYLLAFPLAAWVVGLMMEGEEQPRRTRIFAAMMLGSFLIYSLGLFQLSLWNHWSLKKAVILGVLPFLPGDLIKLAAAGLVYQRLCHRDFRHHSGRRNGNQG
jgi:biotin transport system substrate-specific component